MQIPNGSYELKPAVVLDLHIGLGRCHSVSCLLRAASAGLSEIIELPCLVHPWQFWV